MTRTFSDGREGRIVWHVAPFVPDVELEKTLQEWYDKGYTIREIWRNTPNRAGLESSTVAFSKKEYDEGTQAFG